MAFINFRDPADKIGAALGFVIGMTLIIAMLISHPAEHLILNGFILPDSLYIKAIAYLLIIGICVNLTRNLFVGAHDVFMIFHKFCLGRKKSSP